MQGWGSAKQYRLHCLGLFGIQLCLTPDPDIGVLLWFHPGGRNSGSGEHLTMYLATLVFITIHKDNRKGIWWKHKTFSSFHINVGCLTVTVAGVSFLVLFKLS